MIPLFERGSVRAVILIGAVFLLDGCYYMQAARGQLQVLRKREPIADVRVAPDTPPALAARLSLVEEARQFSIDELALPDNGSYRGYADVERDYVVWNVFAAPEFSLEAKVWCFPVAGCVGYRGYFSEQAAQREAQKLEARGFDIIVGGVAAYSTLGRFDDPILNTMLRWDDTQLVATIFHELAHQVLYIKGDTAFNESFASAVEEFGIERWLTMRGLEDEIASHDERRELRRRLVQLVDAARAELDDIYSLPVTDDEKRALKERRLGELSEKISEEFHQSRRDASAWLENGLNNARLASMALYDGRLPAFREMLRLCNSELDCFYAEAKRLSKFDKEQRDLELDALHQAEETPPVGAGPAFRTEWYSTGIHYIFENPRMVRSLKKPRCRPRQFKPTISAQV